MQWEYVRQVFSPTNFSIEANEYGKGGWELISITPFGNGIWLVCVFKRLIPAAPVLDAEKPQRQPDLQIIGNMQPAPDLPPQTESAEFPPQHEGGIPYCDAIIKERERKTIDRKQTFISNAQYRIKRDQEYIEYLRNDGLDISFNEWDDWQYSLKNDGLDISFDEWKKKQG
jgi:hypothetical protein